MTTVARNQFAVKPLVAAVALACTAYNSAHAVTANQMPGAGLITAVSTGATVNGLTTGGAVINLVSSPTAAQISLGGATAPRAVIQWGGAGTGALGETLNPPGFNVGPGASLNFETAGGFGIGAVLNVDASGSISQILGMVRGDTIAGGSNGYTTIFIANANGVTVGPSARIIAPWGVGLLGADMTGGTAKYEFTRQNGAGVSFVDVTTGQSDVIVGGVINGDAVANIPANFILLVGGNVTNTGNMFGAQVGVAAGLRAAPTTDTVNGVAKTTVNRIWRLDSTFPYGNPGAINGNLGTCNGCIEVALATASFVNTGSISSTTIEIAEEERIGIAAGGGTTSYIGISAASSIRSGTLGDTSQLVGLFSDGGIVTNTFSATGKTELYNVVEAYTIGNTLPFLHINQSTKAAGDVTINALTPGSNPSSITTTGAVSIYGGNVVIDSTINHKLNSAGGKQGDVDLIIVGSKSVTITKDVGAGADVVICAAAVGCVAGAGGPITISGNVLADTDSGGNGGIYIVNYGTQSGNTTTISGNLATAKASFDGIYVYNLGLSNSKVVISGTMTTWHDADIGIFSRGSFDFSGNIMASGNAAFSAFGLSTNLLRGPVTADTVGDGSASIMIAAPLSQTKLYPAAVLTAPGVALGYDYFGGVVGRRGQHDGDGRDGCAVRLGGDQAGGADRDRQPGAGGAGQLQRADCRQHQLAAEPDAGGVADAVDPDGAELVGGGGGVPGDQRRDHRRGVRRFRVDGHAVQQHSAVDGGVGRWRADRQRRQPADHQRQQQPDDRGQQRSAVRTGHAVRAWLRRRSGSTSSRADRCSSRAGR